MKVLLPMREGDSHGQGHFGASRGSRTHKGIDVNAYPKTIIGSLCAGKLTKIGYPYRPETELGHMRYVEVTNPDKLRFRYFYCVPVEGLAIGDEIKLDQPLAVVQDRASFSPGMNNHFHLEIKTSDDVFLDPTPFINDFLAQSFRAGG